MKRRVRFAEKIIYETVMDVPEEFAKGPSEKMWLMGKLNSQKATKIKTVLTGIVVADENQNLEDSVL